MIERSGLCLCRVASHQWTGPRVREVAQPVPAHIEDTQGFQTVHDRRAQTAEAVIGHVQLLQSAKTNPVGVWEDGEKEHKSDLLSVNHLWRAKNEADAFGLF